MQFLPFSECNYALLPLNWAATYEFYDKTTLTYYSSYYCYRFYANPFVEFTFYVIPFSPPDAAAVPDYYYYNYY